MTDSSKGLIDFLRARLDDDEEAARKAPPGPWTGTDAEDIGAWSVYDQEWLIASATVYTHDKPMGGKRGPGYIDASATASHIARHDPARVLREVKAKRRIVKKYVEHMRLDRETVETEGQHARSLSSLRAAYWDACRDLAAVYADHPDYREEWKP